MAKDNQTSNAVPQCPKCGKPMKVVNSGHRRYWECVDRMMFSPSSCNGYLEIPGDERLSTQAIARDMAQLGVLGSNSGERKKQQATNRRAATSCRTAAGSPYLSEAERKALENAATILDRLAFAAERAKTELKVLEEDRCRQYAADDRRERLDLAERFLAGLDGAGKRFRAEALAEYINRERGYRAIYIEPDLERIDGVIAGNLNGGHAVDAWESLMLKLGNVLRDVAEGYSGDLTMTGFETFEKRYRQETERSAEIESSPNVVSLSKRSSKR
ncbi:MAG: hypothetical protein AB2807_09940 [Candidatus Sedimenticola endophacoides]